MKILMVVPEFPPYVVGGGGAVYERLARFVADRGHDLTVAYGDFSNVTWFTAQGAVPEEKGYARIPLRLVRTPKQASWLLSALPPTAAGVRRLWSLCSKERWDVAHLHGVGIPLIDIAAAMLRKAGIPYVLTVHGVPASPLQRGALAAGLLRSYLNGVTQRTVRGAGVVTAVSRALLCDPLLPIRHGLTIYNGIDEVSQSEPLAWGGEGPLRLATISRLSINKGLDVAVQAVNEINGDALRVRLDLYGVDGGEESMLRSLASSGDRREAIAFRGTFAPTERAEILQRYHGLVIPSRVEGFGLAALEGLAHGLPVIASNVDGLAEVLTPQDSLLVPPGDVEALKGAILSLRDPGVRRALSSAGKERARAFLWPELLAQYEEALFECVKA